MKGKNRHISIMAVVNLTDDSFYSGNRYLGADICSVVGKALEDGAEIIDLGACSTRPGSAPVSEEEEWRRLEQACVPLRKAFPGVRFSVDTFRAEVIRRCYDVLGDFLANDVYGCDPLMLPTVAELGLEYVATSPVPTSEVEGFFDTFAAQAATLGIDRWMLDPGFGFGKTLEDNFTLLENLPNLLRFERPLFIGVSRKSFIYKPLGLTPETCLEQTSRVHLQVLRAGADILRVHDVSAARAIIEQYRQEA